MTAVTVLSFGCDRYSSDVEQMRGVCVQAKFEVVPLVENADVVVLHVCSKGEQDEFWLTLGELEMKHPHKIKIITGCIPKKDPERLKKYSLVATRQIHKIAEAIEETLADNVVQFTVTKELPPLNLPRVRDLAYTQTIPIARACQGVCQYCKSKRKGSPYSSYPISEIRAEVEKAVLLGAREILLFSPDGGAYGVDIKTNFPTLLRDLVKIEGDYIIHLPTIHPHTILKYKDDFMSIFKDDKIRKFLHIPLLSVSSVVLEDMGRPYTLEQFLELVLTLREKFPSLTIETEILTGHPLESEKDFWELQTAIRKFNPDQMHIVNYNPKLRTRRDAAEVVPLSEEEQARRLRILQDMNNNISKLQNERWRDWQGSILVDVVLDGGQVQGRNFAYKPIVVHALATLGDILQVKVSRSTNMELIGDVVLESER